MNKELLPLLLENTVGKSSNETLENISKREQDNQRLSAWLVQDQLQLFDQAMKLQLDALTFAAEHVSQWSKADHVIVAMACRTFNHLRAAAYLVLSGYWAEAWHLQRGAFEAMTREVYFYENPDEISKWLKKKHAGKVPQWQVTKLIKKIYGKETYKAHKGVYVLLSDVVHPNRKAIELETWNDKEGKLETWVDEERKDEECIGIRSVLGGYIDVRYFLFQFHCLMTTASNATTALKFVGLYGATDTWEQQCDKLRDAVYGFTAKYKQSAKQRI